MARQNITIDARLTVLLSRTKEGQLSSKVNRGYQQKNLMIKQLFITVLLFQLLLPVNIQAATFKVLPQNGMVAFSIQYLKFWTVEGCFSDVYGGLFINEDNGELNGISGDIVTESLDTGFEYRDERLMSSTYFHQQQFPTIHFQSNSVEYSSQFDFVIKGTITIKGISKPIVFKGQAEHFQSNSVKGINQTIYFATGMVDREQFGIGPVDSYHPEAVLISRNAQFKLITSICRDNDGGEVVCQPDSSLSTRGFTCEKSGSQ